MTFALFPIFFDPLHHMSQSVTHLTTPWKRTALIHLPPSTGPPLMSILNKICIDLKSHGTNNAGKTDVVKKIGI